MSDGKQMERIQLKLLYKQRLGNLTGQVHSCVSMEINDHLFLVDNRNFYCYLTEKENRNFKFKSYMNQHCTGLIVVDGNFCYTLSHQGDKTSSGLRLYDINNILSKDKETSFCLDEVQVGVNGHFDWNKEYSRISFLKSFRCLCIVPSLHRNSITLIGMDNRESYIATRKIKDKFIALNNDNNIYCWSVITGKLMSINKLANGRNYSNFQLFKNTTADTADHTYNREWYSKILLVGKENCISNQISKQQDTIKDENYPQVQNQTTFLQSQDNYQREFRLIEIINEKEVEEHLQFTHTFYQGKEQSIYFDNKTQYMLEKLHHPRIFIYEKQMAEEGAFNRVQWKLIKRFSKFPQDLENETTFIQTMSPCFQIYIDLDRTEGGKQFVIKDTFSSNIIYKIDYDLMNPIDENPKDIMKRFRWIDKQLIQVINKEGIEKIIDLSNNQKEIEYNAIPIFDNEEIQNDPNQHYFNNRKGLKIDQVLQRLKRKYQKYKSSYYLEHKHEASSMYLDLFSIDYQIDNCNGMHSNDMSFTFLHWKIIEQLEKNKLSIDLIDNSQIELMCYNILPGGNTILHKLYKQGPFIKYIFMTSQPDEEDISKIKFHVPFILNLDHLSPMHYSFKLQDFRSVHVYLTYLQAYGIDHHSRAIADILPEIIESDVPSLVSYLDSRLQQTYQTKKLNKGCLKKNSYGITESQIWFNDEQLKNKLMETKIAKHGKIIERPIKVEILDITRVFYYEDELCDKFYGALADTDNYNVFTSKGVQKLIEFNYHHVQSYTIWKLLIPFMMFQVVLFTYLNFVFQQEHNLIAGKIDLPLKILLGFFSIYFLKNEVIQMMNDGFFAYMSSIWNYIDITTPTIILCILTTNTFDYKLDPTLERSLQAIGVFFMWIKLLYFFRVFKSYGYLIRLLILVIDDMRTFMAVFFFTIVAFSDSLLTIAKGNTEENMFVTSTVDSILYTYRITLGDFNVEEFGNVAVVLVYALFILCTVFNTIVMLNLLIAIISDTYANVKENAVNASYQEMAAMISENSYLVPSSLKANYAQKNRNLLCVTDLEQEMQANTDEINNALENLKKTSFKSLEQVKSNYKGLKKYIANLSLSNLRKQEERNNKILNELYPQQFIKSPSSQKELDDTLSNQRKRSSKSKQSSIKRPYGVVSLQKSQTQNQ